MWVVLPIDFDSLMQVDNMLKKYVIWIQELEYELQLMQHVRIPLDTPPGSSSSSSSRNIGESIVGPGFGVAGIDGDIYLRTGTRFQVCRDADGQRILSC